MANINSRLYELDLDGSDFAVNLMKSVKEYLEEQDKFLAKTSVKHVTLRMVLCLDTHDNRLGDIYGALLLEKMATGKTEFLLPENHAVFDFKTNRFIWKNRDIYLTAREKYTVYMILIGENHNDKVERNASAQAIWRLKVRYGDDFPVVSK